MSQKLIRISITFAIVLLGFGIFYLRSRPQVPSAPVIGPEPKIRVELHSQGLPPDFFTSAAEKCRATIIGYRFVVWLNNEDVAVGFNTSPYCRSASDQKVDGSARILIYDTKGKLKASRDISYLADGYGEIVGDGAATRGPKDTLLFRLSSVNLDPEGQHESPSTVLLLDKNLKEVAHIEQFLEQTTFLDHALVFQKDFTLTGPRTYTVIDGVPPSETEHWEYDWPVGTLDRKFGEHAIAYINCAQELRPGQYSQSNIIYANAKKRCNVNQLTKGKPGWSSQLYDGETATIIGVLSDGSVLGQVHAHGDNTNHLVIWKHDGTTIQLPWVPSDIEATFQGAADDLTRYAALAIDTRWRCAADDECKDSRWIIFDRSSQIAIVNRMLPNNARAALSPDGHHYASFEAGELRIYSLPL
jgi:hypothetical protein